MGDGQVSSKSRERWLPYSKIKRTKASSLRRHAVHAFVHYASLDTLSAALRYWGSDNIANPNGFAGSMAAYNAQNHFVFLPHILDIPVPPILVTWALVLTMVIGIWQGMSWIYHLFAFIAVGSGLWEVSSYEVDLFDQPWKADSMLDLWGRRWHQIFRVRPSSLSNHNRTDMDSTTSCSSAPTYLNSQAKIQQAPYSSS